MGPGATPTTLIPYSPHSSARLRVMLSTAALAAEACTCGGEREVMSTTVSNSVAGEGFAPKVKAGGKHRS